MKQIKLSNPIFHDAEKAREHLESTLWPEGPVCPHCGGMGKIYEIKGKSARPGLRMCSYCRKQFTVTVGTLFERSHVSLDKWLLAVFLINSSKKGISSHQLHRMLGVTYKTAWFMSHRVREAMGLPAEAEQLGGEGKIVEADETFWGGRSFKPAHVKGGYAHKLKIFSLVERGGSVRSFHVPSVTGKTLKPILQKQVQKDTHIMTDDSKAYKKLNKHFDKHDVICHSRGEYVRGIVYTNTIENFFSILKRGLTGVFQHVSEHHLQRYVSEFDFRYSRRKMSDTERFNATLAKIEGKRLVYLSSTVY